VCEGEWQQCEREEGKLNNSSSRKRRRGVQQRERHVDAMRGKAGFQFSSS